MPGHNSQFTIHPLQKSNFLSFDQLKANASMEVLYVRGREQVSVQATIGRTEFEVDDGSGIVERFQSSDYLIRASRRASVGSTVWTGYTTLRQVWASSARMEGVLKNCRMKSVRLQ